MNKIVLTVNAQQIKIQSDASLSALAMEQTQKYDSIFSRVKASAALLAQRASDVYCHLDMEPARFTCSRDVM